MAEFCAQCTDTMFPPGTPNDFAGLSTPDDTAQGKYAVVLCEGCGPTQVDHTGKCVAPDCLRRHGATTPQETYQKPAPLPSGFASSGRLRHRWNGPLPDVGEVADDDPGYFG